MLRTQFEEELEKLHNQFYAMGTEVLAQINKTVRAFVSHDRDLAQKVIDEDENINEYEVKLEKKSLEIIALQQPVANDLRTVVTVLKASSDVERMGDHAAGISRATIRMKGELRIKEVEEAITKMGKEVRYMVEETMNAYINSDVEKAKEIALYDENINDFYHDIQQLAIDLIKENPDAVVAGKDYFQVITYLERIGDYAKNICEWIIYLKTGKIVEL